MTNAQVTVGKFVFDESWSGYALQRSGAAVTPFLVPAVDSTGHTNISCNNSAGTIRFWFEPTIWSSATQTGTGPGSVATLLELDAIGKGESANVWSLQISADGTLLSLVAQSDNQPTLLLQTEISWLAHQSHLIALDYSPKETTLFLDGQIVAQGAGVQAVPPELAALCLAVRWREKRWRAGISTSCFAWRSDAESLGSSGRTWTFHFTGNIALPMR